MRSCFNATLLDIAKNDDRIFMILADIGYGEIEPFRDAFPERWYNCGVAEQNMTGVACGVAMERSGDFLQRLLSGFYTVPPEVPEGV